MPPNLANTLYFRMLDQERSNQLARREGEQQSADILLRAGDQAEKSKQAAFDRNMTQAETLGKLAAAEGKPSPTFTNKALQTTSDIGARGEQEAQREVQRKSQLLRDIQTMKDKAAMSRRTAQEGATTDRLGMQMQNALDIEQMRTKGANYRAHLHEANPNRQPTPPGKYDPKRNPYVRQLQDNEALIRTYGNMFNEDEVKTLREKSADLMKRAAEYAGDPYSEGDETTPAPEVPSDDEFGAEY